MKFRPSLMSLETRENPNAGPIQVDPITWLPLPQNQQIPVYGPTGPGEAELSPDFVGPHLPTWEPGFVGPPTPTWMMGVAPGMIFPID